MNDGVQRFPALLIASMFGFRQAEFFEATDEAGSAPKMDLTQ